jgi:elongation of very long chain fatty acids protein 4
MALYFDAAFAELVTATDAFVNQFMEGAALSPLTKGYVGLSVEWLLTVDLGYLFIVLFSLLFLKPSTPPAAADSNTKKVKKEKGFMDHFKLFHNFFLFALSLYMCLEAIRQAVIANYSVFGNDLGKGTPEQQKGMANIIWIFYMSKSYEFFDTFIMIINGKWKQVSFLHVYHHSTIFAIWWMIARFAPGGDCYFCVILNSFVHVVMYAYYFFTSIGWNFIRVVKPYITSLQMTQFMAMTVQSLYDYMYPPVYPRNIVILLGGYMLTLLTLFGNFFIQSYLKPKKKKQ